MSGKPTKRCAMQLQTARSANVCMPSPIRDHRDSHGQNDAAPTFIAAVNGEISSRVERAARGSRTKRRRRRALAALCGAMLLAVGLWGSDRRGVPSQSGVGVSGLATAREGAGVLRLASFNIHSGRNRAGDWNLNAIASIVRDADVVGLFEVRSCWLETEPNQAACLAERTGHGWLFAPSERRWWHNHWGNGLLSRARVGRWTRVALPGTRGKAYRNYVEAEVFWGGTRLKLLVTHLDTQQDRAAQLAIVARRFLQLAEPVVLMGDLNTGRDDPALSELLAHPGVVDCLANSSGARPSIDWILGRGVLARDGGLIETDASDHPCAWTEIELVPRLAQSR